jgi:hypothetical protein
MPAVPQSTIYNAFIILQLLVNFLQDFNLCFKVQIEYFKSYVEVTVAFSKKTP